MSFYISKRDGIFVLLFSLNTFESVFKYVSLKFPWGKGNHLEQMLISVILLLSLKSVSVLNILIKQSMSHCQI